MIQFRWKIVSPDNYSAGPVTTVDGELCVLQYRLHFVPSMIASGDIVLKQARDIDAEWKDVEINHE